MPKMKSFKTEYGISLEIDGVWHKFYAGVEIEVENGDKTDDIKKKAWNTVINEVEKQIDETRKHIIGE